jgi:hypothetical protein
MRFIEKNIILAMFVLVPQISFSQDGFNTEKNLLGMCAEDYSKTDTYVAGVVDTALVSQYLYGNWPFKMCLPKNVTIDQLRHIACEDLADNIDEE